MRRLAGIALLMVLLVGCGRGCDRASGPREQVRGTVYYQGQPVPGGTIVFTPDPDRNSQGPLARGAIGGDGSYDLGAGPDGGAIAGWHRVTVMPTSSPSAGVLSLPARFADSEQCGQVCEVKPGQANVIDFHLQ